MAAMAGVVMAGVVMVGVVADGGVDPPVHGTAGSGARPDIVGFKGAAFVEVGDGRGKSFHLRSD